MNIQTHPIILKKGKEGIFLQRHHWIFSGAIASYPQGYRDGDLAPIHSSNGKLLGWGFFNKRCSLAGRVVSFGEKEPYAALKDLLKGALKLRETLANSTDTTAFRLVNGEGDGLPGLIVDKYGPYLVIQTGALGMRKLLPFIVDQLRELLPLKGIYDKSLGTSLKEEGVEPQEKILWGEIPDRVEIKEKGIRYLVAIKEGQKTGFFLDQREMRSLVSELSKGKRVLNAFCYTGGYTLSALKGGAVSVDSVDLSASALELCKENVSLNGYTQENAFFQSDVFDFLEQKTCDYDLVILDPPAFAKKRRDIPAACKGYKRLFTKALKKMPQGSTLLVSSCSHYMTEELFTQCVRDAALDAQRALRIIGSHRLAFDHPINIFHPESAYLKSLLLHITE